MIIRCALRARRFALTVRSLFVGSHAIRIHRFAMFSLVYIIVALMHILVLTSCPASATDLNLKVGQTVNVLRSSTTSPISIHSFVTRSSCSLCEKSLDENVIALQRIYPGLEYRKYIAGAADDELEYYRRECPLAIVVSDELSLYRKAVSSYSGSFWLVVDNDRRMVFSEVTSNTRTVEELLSVLPARSDVSSGSQGLIATIPLQDFSPLVDNRRVYQTADTSTIAVVLNSANCVILHDLEAKRTRYIRLDSALRRSMLGFMYSTQVGSTDTLMILANDFQNYRLCLRFNIRTGNADTLPLSDLLTDSAVNWSTRAVYSPRAQVVITSPFRTSNHRPLKPKESLDVGIPLHRTSGTQAEVVQYGINPPEEYTTYAWTGMMYPAYRLQDVVKDVVCSWPANCERVYCWSPSTEGARETVYSMVDLPAYYRTYKKDYPYYADRDVKNNEYSLRSFPEDVFVRDSMLGVIFSNYIFSDTSTDGRQYSVQLGYHVQNIGSDGVVRVVAQELLNEGVSATYSFDTKSILISRKVGRTLEVYRRQF